MPNQADAQALDQGFPGLAAYNAYCESLGRTALDPTPDPAVQSAATLAGTHTLASCEKGLRAHASWNKSLSKRSDCSDDLRGDVDTAYSYFLRDSSGPQRQEIISALLKSAEVHHTIAGENRDEDGRLEHLWSTTLEEEVDLACSLLAAGYYAVGEGAKALRAEKASCAGSWAWSKHTNSMGLVPRVVQGIEEIWELQDEIIQGGEDPGVTCTDLAADLVKLSLDDTPAQIAAKKLRGHSLLWHMPTNVSIKEAQRRCRPEWWGDVLGLVDSQAGVDDF